MREFAAVVAAFLCGSIPFGVILVRLRVGVDVRSVGSGNIGATNVARAGGVALGVAVLALDILKGAAAVLLGQAIAGVSPAPLTTAALICAPVAGHVFTPWLRFQGGKGVASAVGALAVADLRLTALALAVFAVVAVVTRIVSVSSMAAAAAAAIGALAGLVEGGVTAGVVAAAALIVVRHQQNIRRLLRGVEPRFAWSRPRGGDSR